MKMKPGYQLEPVIKKAMKFFLSLFEHRIELSIFKKKEKIKRRKLLIQVNIGIHSIIFLNFFFHQNHLGNFHTITRERISDTDDFISQIWHFLDSDGQSVKEKEIFKIRLPLCSMKTLGVIWSL